MNVKQTRYFIHEIIKSLNLKPEDKAVYSKYALNVLKNKELRMKYIYFRLLMPIRYTNKLFMSINAKKVEKIRYELGEELATELIKKQASG